MAIGIPKGRYFVHCYLLQSQEDGADPTDRWGIARATGGFWCPRMDYL